MFWGDFLCSVAAHQAYDCASVGTRRCWDQKEIYWVLVEGDAENAECSHTLNQRSPKLLAHPSPSLLDLLHSFRGGGLGCPVSTH